MKRLLTLTSAVALMLTASTSFAVDETSWGAVKANITYTADGSAYLSFGGLQPAAKKGGKGGGGDTSDPSDGELTYMGKETQRVRPGHAQTFRIVNDDLAGTDYKYLVKFKVNNNSLTKPVDITMITYGKTLSELVIVFAPAGLDFLIDAELYIKLGNNRVDLNVDTLKVNHEHHDGTVEDATITEIRKNDTNVELFVTVPGFSRYSLGGGF